MRIIGIELRVLTDGPNGCQIQEVAVIPCDVEFEWAEYPDPFGGRYAAMNATLHTSDGDIQIEQFEIGGGRLLPRKRNIRAESK